MFTLPLPLPVATNEPLQFQLQLHKRSWQRTKWVERFTHYFTRLHDMWAMLWKTLLPLSTASSASLLFTDLRCNDYYNVKDEGKHDNNGTDKDDCICYLVFWITAQGCAWRESNINNPQLLVESVARKGWWSHVYADVMLVTDISNWLYTSRYLLENHMLLDLQSSPVDCNFGKVKKPLSY